MAYKHFDANILVVNKGINMTWNFLRVNSTCKDENILPANVIVNFREYSLQ